MFCAILPMFDHLSFELRNLSVYKGNASFAHFLNFSLSCGTYDFNTSYLLFFYSSSSYCIILNKI